MYMYVEHHHMCFIAIFSTFKIEFYQLQACRVAVAGAGSSGGGGGIVPRSAMENGGIPVKYLVGCLYIHIMYDSRI